MIPYETSIKYLTAGYAVILIVLAVYLVSLMARWKRLKRDYETWQDLEKK